MIVFRCKNGCRRGVLVLFDGNIANIGRTVQVYDLGENQSVVYVRTANDT